MLASVPSGPWRRLWPELLPVVSAQQHGWRHRNFPAAKIQTVLRARAIPRLILRKREGSNHGHDAPTSPEEFRYGHSIGSGGGWSDYDCTAWSGTRVGSSRSLEECRLDALRHDSLCWLQIVC